MAFYFGSSKVDLAAAYIAFSNPDGIDNHCDLGDLGVRQYTGNIDYVYITEAGYQNRNLKGLHPSNLELTEMTAPAAPAANNVRIFAQDNGAGKTQLMALFATGAAVQIAIEP
jgi:hypothetical protein